MKEERRGLSTADLARPAEAQDRSAVVDREAAAERDPVVGRGPVNHEDSPAAYERTMLFEESEAGQFRSRWTEIQTAFVDSPRSAVERADSLVAETMKRMAEMFAAERANLEGQWDRGGDVTTEDLRIALQRYRAFFDRLLNL
jgi:hypothetical protein